MNRKRSNSILQIHFATGQLGAGVCVLAFFHFGFGLGWAQGTDAEVQEKEGWTEQPFAIEQVTPQTGWKNSPSITAEQWKPVRQPNLAERLAKAPGLELREVTPPPERCWVGHQPYLVPNPDGESWDMVFPYFKRYREDQEVVIHDFGTGKTGQQVLSTGRGDSVLTREPIGFHMQPAYYAEGRLIFEMYGPVLFVVYDPAADAFVHGSKPFGDDVINGRCVLGTDGMIYGMGWPRDKSGFVAYRFDPLTYEAERFETFGPSNPNRRELYREVRMSGDWLYAAVGNRPWHLVAFNVESGEGRLLAATEEIRGSGDTIEMTPLKGGLRGTVRQAAWISGIDAFDGNSFEFWLHDGRISQREGNVPPWSDSPGEEAPSANFNWDREFQVWPDDFAPPSPPPEFRQDAGDPDPSGRVALPYRLGDQEQWKTLEYDVQMYPGIVHRLKEVNDHVLFATDSGYGQHVFYNIKTRQIMRVGGTLSPYSIGLFNNRLYVSGYPNSQMYEYDFTRSLGLKQEQPNPKRVAWIGKFDDTHNPLGGTVGAADGRVYNAGTTYGRRRVGGGFGWYDTETGKAGGMPFEGHRIFWMITAEEGRYLLLSSKRDKNGQLFCWDTRKNTFIYKKRIFGGGRPGPIAEALPGGLVIGHHDSGVLYGLRVDTGEVLWRKKVPAKPVTAFGDVRRHRYSFRRGPDGNIWSFFGDTLVRIDPLAAKVEPVGKVAGGPGQLAFAEGRVWIAGGSGLQVIAEGESKE